MKKKIIAGALVIMTLIMPSTAFAEGGTQPPGPILPSSPTTTVTTTIQS